MVGQTLEEAVVRNFVCLFQYFPQARPGGIAARRKTKHSQKRCDNETFHGLLTCVWTVHKVRPHTQPALTNPRRPAAAPPCRSPRLPQRRAARRRTTWGRWRCWDSSRLAGPGRSPGCCPGTLQDDNRRNSFVFCSSGKKRWRDSPNSLT